MRSMTMDELKATIGRNLVELRRAAGMTQLELAEKLNYSDKAVSKWECGDAVPDILVLTRLADVFGVTVDYLTATEHIGNEGIQLRRGRIHTVVALLSSALVWLIATMLYVTLTLTVGAHFWLVYIYAIPVSALLTFIFACVWHWRACGYVFISLMVWGILLSLFLTFILYHPFEFHSPWMFFLLGVPGQMIIILWSRLRPRHRLR